MLPLATQDTVAKQQINKLSILGYVVMTSSSNKKQTNSQPFHQSNYKQWESCALKHHTAKWRTVLEQVGLWMRKPSTKVRRIRNISQGDSLTICRFLPCTCWLLISARHAEQFFDTNAVPLWSSYLWVLSTRQSALSTLTLVMTKNQKYIHIYRFFQTRR